MLTQPIADSIHGKVGALVNQPLSVVDAECVVLATSDPRVDENVAIGSVPWAVDIHHAGKIAGYVVLGREVPNYEEIAPLIRSIAELMLHQSLLLEQLPQQEERLDKFIYDLLAGNHESDDTIAAEARLFEID